MENKKPIQVVLLLAVIIQGLYLLILIGVTVFYRPFLKWYGVSYMNNIEQINRPIPYLFLCGSVVVLLIVICFSCWIYIRVKRNAKLLFPCILAFVFVAVSLRFHFIFIRLENGIARSFEQEQFIVHVSMLDAYALVYPVYIIGMIFLAIGAALALYRERYVVMKCD